MNKNLNLFGIIHTFVVCVFIISVVVINSGCIHWYSKEQLAQNKMTDQHDLNNQPYQLSIGEASLDIPFPLDIVPLDQYMNCQGLDADQMVLGYESRMNVDQLGAFYEREMEFQGWKLISKCVVPDFEQLYVYKKPGTISTIVLTAEPCKKGMTRLVVYVGSMAKRGDHAESCV